jgi:hypothetical protein
MNKSTILTGWNFMRAIRLILGVIIIVQSIQQQRFSFAILGLLFAGMAVFNVGCCGAGGCGVPTRKNNNTTTDISYEEVV